MKKLLCTMLFGTALVLGACGGGGDDGASDGSSDNGGGSTDTAASGEEIFQNNCASCHGSDLSGGMGPDLTKVGSRYSADEIANIIKNGRGQMPPQKQVSKEDRQAVASWLAKKK
ncbi:cytochrome c551 [Virgibacillus siamensis]|uniref:cytochrome c551 n=1 Tax=Virgibacillus siamensis TaxID=480071 RepID=UPI000985855E|nr:cytochrome c [Virgibacillus siamensis]